MEGKTNRRFDGIVRHLKEPKIQQKARRFGVLTAVFFTLVALASNGLLPHTTLGEGGSASANRLWSSGAELNTTTADVEITSSSGTISISSSTVRSGDYAYRANPTSSTGVFYKTWAGSAQTNKFWFRQYIRIATAPGADTYIMQIGNGSSGKISVRLTSSSTLQLRNEEDNSNIGSASSALSTNTWYRVELFIDTTTISSTDATLLLDGASVGSSTSENLASGVDRWTWGVANSTTADLFFDDLAVNDSTARSSNNWPGEGKIVHMQPDATGSNSAWSNTYTSINAATWTNDSTFIYSQTNNQTEDVNLESASSAGISSGDRVKLTSVGVRVRTCGDSGGGGPGCFAGFGSDLNYATRITAGGNTDETQVGLPDTDTTTFYTNDNDQPKLNATTSYDLPGSSTAPWTANDLDSAEIGVKNYDSTGLGFRVSLIWLQVEYVADSGGRIFSSGFELQSTTAGMEYTNNIGTTPTVDTTNERTGAAALRTNASASTSGWEYDFVDANTAQDYYFRAYIRVATAPGTLTNIMEFYDSANSVQASIRMNIDRTLELWNDEDTVQIGSDSSAVALSTWTRLEMRLDCDSTCAGAGSATLDARINGSSFASSSTVNHANAAMTIRAGVLTSTTADFSWDDIALNQAVGTNQNSWPGDGAIIYLRPNADDATNTAWTNGFANVDETTPDDATTLVSETTSDDIDDYELSASGLSAGDTVNLVSVGVRFRTSSATQEDFRVRLKDAAAGVAIESDTISPASTTWTTNATASPKNPPLTAYTRPDLSSTWTNTELDTAQIGVRDVLSGSGTVQVSALWLLVDYTAALFSVSGTCDQYDQTTDCTDDGSNEIAVAVNGTLQAQTDTTVDGAWSVTGITTPTSGDIITVFVNGEATDSEEAVAVAKYDGTGDMTGVVLYQRHLTIGSADNQTLTNSDIDAYDNSVSGDEDIFFDVSVGNDLTVDSVGSYTDEELYIVAGNTFRPASGGGADVTTVHIENDGTWTADSNAVTVNGNWQNDGTFTAGTSAVTFNSTSTGRTLSGTMTSASAFYDLIFNGVSGGWTFSAAVAAGNDFTLTNGAVADSGNNLTITRDFTLANTVGVSYTASASTITVSRTWSDVGNKFVRGTSAVVLDGTGDITTTGSFNNLSLGYSTKTSTITTSNFNLYGTITFNGGTVTTSGGGWMDIHRSTTGTPFVFASATTITGSRSLYVRNNSNSITTTIAGGNYGTWSVVPFSASGSLTSSTYELAGNLTNTGNFRLEADGSSTGNVFNSNNHSITTSILDVGAESRTGPWTANFGSSTIDINNTSDAFGVVSNGGSHTFNLGSSNINVAGNVHFNYGTGSVTVSEGTSTLTWDHTSGTKTYSPNGQSLYNVVLDASGGTVEPDAAVDISNNFDITNGTFDNSLGNNYSVTVDNNLTGNSGTWTLEMRASTWTVSGNWDTSAVTTDQTSISEGTSTVVMNGAGTKTISLGSNQPWLFRFYNLTVGQSGNTTQLTTAVSYNHTLTLGTGTIDLNSQTLYNQGTSTDSPVSLDPSGTWGTGNGNFVVWGSGSKTLPAFTYNSGFTNEMNSSAVITLGTGTTTITGNLGMGCCSRASELTTGNQTLNVNGNVTWSNNLAILNAGSSTITVGGNWVNTNGGVFNAGTSSVVLNGSSTQTVSGTLTGARAFYNLTITNNSGLSASDCERTGFSASVDFAGNVEASNNYTITTANVRVEYNSGSTYTFNNINWNGQATGTRIYFRNSAASGTWLLNVSGTQTAVSYVNVSRSDASGGNQIAANDGTNTDCNNNTNWLFNTAPDSPTSLTQKKVTGGATMSVGDWTNETQVLFEATATDTDNPDTLQLCVETDILGTGFSNAEDLCGSGVAYSGSGVTVAVTITGLTDASEYHWQARVKDAAGAYSSWVSFGANAESARDHGIDTTACTYSSSIYDGTVEDTDATYNDGSLTSLSANWDAFSCTASGLNNYEYSIGTTAGGTDIRTWTDNSTTESVTATGLVLRTNQRYYLNVRANDNAANVSSLHSSNGQDVLPEISMSVGASSITFATLNAGNNRSDTETITTTTSTNGYGGYVIRQYVSGLLGSGGTTVPMFSAGSYASPAAWPSGACSGTTCGYGYTSNDTTIQGSNLFGTGTLYAPFSTSAFGDIVADHTTAVDGSTGKVVNEQFTITHKVAVDTLQEALSYSTIVYYIATGTF